MSDRPLHPDGMEDIFQHPIKGCVLKHGDYMLECYANDIGRGPSFDDKLINLTVERFRNRCELGTWLTERHPDPKYKLTNHLFVDAILPVDFGGEDAESEAVLGRVDMAQSVMDAGGACTICGAPNDPDAGIDHVVGCEFMSWQLFQVMNMILDADGEPTLADVVRSAHEQIERMA